MSYLESSLAIRPGERGRGQFDVLIVEDDAGSCDEYCEFLATLGYSCHSSADGMEALNIIARNPDIGIVLTDLVMPALDGLSLLSELQARFNPFRPLVPIVVTGQATLETAVEAMRSDAIDFLRKPVSPAMLSAAMRRASARWAMLNAQFRLLKLMELGNETSAKPSAVSIYQPDLVRPDRGSLQKFVRAYLKARQRRADFMDVSMFADPAWDIMLDLTSAALEGRSVPAFSAGVAANVPMSTALRYVKRLVEDGTVKRWDDPDDKRRSLLALEDHALEKMIAYLSSIWRSTTDDLMLAS